MRPFAPVLAIALALSALPPAQAQAPAATGEHYPGTLDVIGALHCRATPQQNGRGGEGRLILCQYQQANHPDDPVELIGEMIGTPLRPSGDVMWNVLAPTPEVLPTDIAGSYGRDPRFDYALTEIRDDILYGGLGDTFALEPVTAGFSVAPSTRLTLRLSGESAGGPAPDPLRPR